MMVSIESVEHLENRRLEFQNALERKKSRSERNRMGQFATPTLLASEMLEYALSLIPKDEPIRFLDPGFGNGSFYSALLRTFPRERIASARGYEIDQAVYEDAVGLWNGTGLDLRRCDFTSTGRDDNFNLVICNPPYVRHHHLSSKTKRRLQTATSVTFNGRISGLAGLYCYFLGLTDSWMSHDGIAGWLIPSEFMDVNYGSAVKRYLTEMVTLLRIHRFDPHDVQFADALVSSCIVWFRKSKPSDGHVVESTSGGSLLRPNRRVSVSLNELIPQRKWSRIESMPADPGEMQPVLSDFFTVKRGAVTGDNGFFILSLEEISSRDLPVELFSPILPSPRYIDQDVIEADATGQPLINRRRFLLDVRANESEIGRRFPSVALYLNEGKEKGVHLRYVCRNRSPWYSQERRPPAPILFTYMGRINGNRANPFRFILNLSKARVPNVFHALYPKPWLSQVVTGNPELMHRIWVALSEISGQVLIDEGREYGGGLLKLEPNELGNVPVPRVADLVPEFRGTVEQGRLLDAGESFGILGGA